jgi:hypothetical protein
MMQGELVSTEMSQFCDACMSTLRYQQDVNNDNVKQDVKGMLK